MGKKGSERRWGGGLGLKQVAETLQMLRVSGADPGSQWSVLGVTGVMGIEALMLRFSGIMRCQS